MKKYISILTAIVFLILVSSSAFAGFQDVPGDAAYKGAQERISALGIMGGYDDGTFKPDNLITREQFAKIIVVAAGLEETANTLKGSTIFPDVDPNGWSSGYINTALDKGYITGMVDGKFHPGESITFAQACTIMVRALGYADTDISGLWPRNYIEKAKILGLVPGIIMQSSDAIPRWAAAVMIDRLLVTKVKSTNASDAATFADATGLYTECIILGTSSTSDKLTEGQILTDKGTYYLKDSNTRLELGNSYKLVIKNDTIETAYNVLKPLLEINVSNAVDTTITYRKGYIPQTMTLPQKTVYYYQGVEQDYDSLKDILHANTSIVFAYNENKTGFDYAVVFDPVYSKPEIVSVSVPASKKLGSIDFNSVEAINRNTIDNSVTPAVNKTGEAIKISQIKDKDVVYQVSDIWGQNKYILVIDHKESGDITGIFPNKVSPTTVQIDGEDYALNKYFSFKKLNSSPGSFKYDDSITALIGYDGKVVDMYSPNDADNSDYAFVLNYSRVTSKDILDYGKISYNVKLLMAEGSVVTYKADSNPTTLKSKLVTYRKVDEETVALTEVEYMGVGEVVINKDGRQFDDNYVTRNVKIFNLVTNEAGADAQVELLSWDELPYGRIPEGKVLYFNRTGDFRDVNIMLLDDIFDKEYKMGVVSKVEYKSSRQGGSYNYTLLIEGEEYVYSVYPKMMDVGVGSVLKVKLLNGGINSLKEIKHPIDESTIVQAVDIDRIKINGNIYWLKDNVSIYTKDYSDVVEAVGLEDIETNKSFGKVSIYLDKPEGFNGKIEMIVISK